MVLLGSGAPLQTFSGIGAGKFCLQKSSRSKTRCVGEGCWQRDGVPVFVTGLCHLCAVLWQSSAGGPSPLPVLSVALYKWHFGSHLFKGGDNELGEMRKTLRPGCFSE